MVRPLLEYASELWSGQTSQTFIQEAEKDQLIFLRRVLGLHRNVGGVANEVVRAETGCERIVDRWSKLKLGYWRRIFLPLDTNPTRLLTRIAVFRHHEHTHNTHNASGLGTSGWMPTVKNDLTRLDLETYWTDPPSTLLVGRDEWKTRTYDKVDAASDTTRTTRMHNLSSTTHYLALKAWDQTPPQYAFSVGEVGRLGQHTPERYLDDRRDLKGTRLKLLCRTGSLPLMTRVVREARITSGPLANGRCLACTTGDTEDIQHLVLDCPLYTTHRSTLLTDVHRALTNTSGYVTTHCFNNMDKPSQLAVLLGRRTGDPRAEDRIDRSMKRFLRKAWNRRVFITVTINNIFNTKYSVYQKTAAIA
jgi:hypothetical protein